MSRYPELAAKVDGFFARVIARYPTETKCNSGCSHCCHVRLTITGVEADAIDDLVATWSDDRKASLAENVAVAPPDRCVALTPDGRCLIYDARPIVCRSHGAPIRMKHPHSLPVIASPGAGGTRSTPEGSAESIETCRENFTTSGPAAVDPDCVLDQETLSAMVLAVDRDAGGDGTRFDLADVLSE
jgi:uncharacterized protein